MNTTAIKRPNQKNYVDRTDIRPIIRAALNSVTDSMKVHIQECHKRDEWIMPPLTSVTIANPRQRISLYAHQSTLNEKLKVFTTVVWEYMAFCKNHAISPGKVYKIFIDIIDTCKDIILSYPLRKFNTEVFKPVPYLEPRLHDKIHGVFTRHKPASADRSFVDTINRLLES